MNTNIVPVAVYPSTANVLSIRSITLGPPPNYFYQLVGADGTALKDGNVNMTQEQWDGWSETVDDTEYQLDCISANLGLTRA